MPMLLEWLAENEPDVLAIQETKVDDTKFPFAEIEDAGYSAVAHGQKLWNGVALLSRSPMTQVVIGYQDDLFEDDARMIAAEVDGVSIVNTYVPNGSAVGTDKFVYKLRWLERFRRLLDERYDAGQPLIWLGDINIAPTAHDVYSPNRHYGKVGYHPDEIQRLRAITSWGLTDLFRLHHDGPGNYTFWDFVIPRAVERNLGWRIDHIYGTESIASKCTWSWIDRDARLRDKPSDHTFVMAEIDL